jgi:hypothetical protein
MGQILRKGRRLIAATVLAISLMVFLNSSQFGLLTLAFNYWKPASIADYRLRGLSTDEFARVIEKSIEADEIDEANELVELAAGYGHALPEELVAETQESSLEFGVRNGYDLMHGAATGEFKSFASLTGVLAADYIGIGDLRDIGIQGQKFIVGADYDKLTMGMALFGLATVIPGTGPLDAGASLIKTANKANKLSKPLRIKLTQMAEDLIDTKALKEGLSSFSMPKLELPSRNAMKEAVSLIDWKQVASGNIFSIRDFASKAIPVDTKAAKRAFSQTIRPSVADEVKVIVNSVEVLATNGGLKVTLTALELSDDLNDLNRFGKLSKAMGSKTAPVLRLLGKSAIQLGSLAYQIVSILIAGIIWLTCTLWTVWTTARNIRKLIA